MTSHIYQFCGRYYLQQNGGPIGLTSTASLASLVMKIWDCMWIKLLDREGIKLWLFFRYVDDVRCFLRPFKEGVRWDGCEFRYDKKWEEEDLLSGKTDQRRTTEQLVAAMSSIVDFLDFEPEESGMFANDRLPTLDASIWVCERSCLVKFSFFEKPTCPNRVLQKDTALSEMSIRASLTQEIVRRLKNCSLDLPNQEKQEILSCFAQKLINSGFSIASAQYLLVHGVTKFNLLVKNSNLPENDPKFKPLHPSRDFDLCGRKLRKLLAKTGWFDESEVFQKSKWRNEIPKGWSGCKPVQFPLKGMKYSSIMQVPSSKNGRLLKMLAKAEHRIAKLCGYQVKYVEKSGKQLATMFQPDPIQKTCFRSDCVVCLGKSKNGPSLCQQKGVVYTGICQICEKSHRESPNTPPSRNLCGPDIKNPI